MIEKNTNYAYALTHLDNPTFEKVRNLSTKFYRDLSKPLQDELYEALNRGVDILDSEPQMVAYLHAFGQMHQAKLNYAFKHLPEEFLAQPKINIIDYGCGQALGTMCYADYLRENGYEQKIKTITLIEPSEICLKRAALHASVFFPDAEIKTVSKKFDELEEDDIVCSEETPTLHLLSNVLDMLSFNLDKFAKLVNDCLKGYNQFVCVGPFFNNVVKDNRMTDFASQISGKNSYETFDKRELNPEKDWTCSVLLCTNGTIFIKPNKIELDCDKIFENAVMFSENMEKNLNNNYCKDLFHKLQVCARFGDKRCQNMLGLWYLNGIGTEQNYNNALDWLNKSAEQGYISAYTNLGNQYFKGTGVEKDLKKAAEYYKMSAELGCKGGQTGLGVCYIKGAGVEKDFSAAFSWFEKASKQNYPAGLFRLGLCYLNGWGTDINLAKAIELFTKAGKQKHVKSIKKLIKLFEERKGVEYFSDEQYDVFVEAARLELPELGSIITSDYLPSPTSVSPLDFEYSFKNTYQSLIKATKENIVRDNTRIDGLSQIDNASFLFDVFTNLSIMNGKSLGLYRLIQNERLAYSGNSMYPLVHDNNRGFIIERNENDNPSNHVTAPICAESFWEIFLLDNLEFFLPKFDHHCYKTRKIICSQSDIDNLPLKIKKHIKHNALDTTPKINQILQNLVYVQCVYFNQWSGLMRWNEYYVVESIHGRQMKVKRISGLPQKNETIFKYDCGLRI